jgi:UDP-N-acetyl-D-mannosaminuronate dehydrogenase
MHTIEERTRDVKMTHRISAIGLGYVGLPAVTAFAQWWAQVVADIDSHRIVERRKGYDNTGEVESSALKAPTLKFTTHPHDIGSRLPYRRRADAHDGQQEA